MIYVNNFNQFFITEQLFPALEKPPVFSVPSTSTSNTGNTFVTNGLDPHEEGTMMNETYSNEQFRSQRVHSLETQEITEISEMRGTNVKWKIIIKHHKKDNIDTTT